MAALSSPLASAEPTDEQTEKLVKIAGLLGEAHAIQVLCNGKADQYWRNHMFELLDLEAPSDGKLRTQLVDAFNEAFAAMETKRTECNAQAKSEFDSIARDGLELAEDMNTLISNPD